MKSEPTRSPSRSQTRTQTLGLAVALGSGPVAGAGGCIIPDRDIRATSDDDNPGAVRVVEPIHVVADLLDACASEPGESNFDLTACPQVPAIGTLTPGLVPGGPYCACEGFDGNTLPEFSLYAEDPDRSRDRPADVLYAVALLDLDRETDAPQNYVAYPEHLVPGGAGEYIPTLDPFLDEEPLKPSIGREDNGLWRFRFGKDGGAGVDLCNDDNGNTLAPGLHNLQLMITDRPFFRPERLDAEGEPVVDASGRPLLLPTQYGMPDLAAGATWAVANYVFECHDPMVRSDCACLNAPP